MKSPSQETPRTPTSTHTTQRTSGSAGKAPRTSTHAHTPDSLINSPLSPQETSALKTGEHAIQKSVPRLLAVDEFPTRSQTTEASPPSAESKLETYCKLCCKTTTPVHSVVGPKCHHCQLFEKQCWNLASGNYGGQSSRTQCDTCWRCNPDECRQKFQCMGIITTLPIQ
jgi:hypothetical protein